MQPRELYVMAEAYTTSLKEKDWKTSYFLSWLINLQVKNPVPVNAIYDGLWTTEEERKQKKIKDHKILMQEFGLIGGGTDEHDK